MDIKIPEVGESVREALLAKWFKESGDLVSRDEPICEIETDKITLDLNADAAGVLLITVSEGTTVSIGATIGTIQETSTTTEKATSTFSKTAADQVVTPPSSPSLRRKMLEENLSPDEIVGSGKDGRITMDDLYAKIDEKSKSPYEPRPATVYESPPTPLGSQTTPPLEIKPKVIQSAENSPVKMAEATAYSSGSEERRPMSPLRKRVAERLVAARQQTAMLTTFNEADLSHVMNLRSRYREHFIQRHGIPLGFMPFFVKASVEALKEFPMLNASIDGDDIVIHHFYNICIAIGSEKGLVVPVLRDADKLKFYETDKAISAFSEKIKTNHLTISDLEGGTFTISNGGVYGSMLSTPIINPPQSAVLGMHAIQERPVVRDGLIVIRSMMYLALSYDHRIIDGREAVNFLKKIKEYIEAPEELMLEG